MDKGMAAPRGWRHFSRCKTSLPLESAAASSPLASCVSVTSSLMVSVMIPMCGYIDLLQRWLRPKAIQNTLHVSLDGSNAALYEAIRGHARFDKRLRNLRRLMVAKVAVASLLQHVRLVAGMMRKNLAELPNPVRLAHQEVAESLSVQHRAMILESRACPPNISRWARLSMPRACCMRVGYGG
jgi:hypothetical protein